MTFKSFASARSSLSSGVYCAEIQCQPHSSFICHNVHMTLIVPLVCYNKWREKSVTSGKCLIPKMCNLVTDLHLRKWVVKGQEEHLNTHRDKHTCTQTQTHTRHTSTGAYFSFHDLVYMFNTPLLCCLYNLSVLKHTVKNFVQWKQNKKYNYYRKTFIISIERSL